MILCSLRSSPLPKDDARLAEIEASLKEACFHTFMYSIIHVSFMYHSCIIHVSFMYHSCIIHVRSCLRFARPVLASKRLTKNGNVAWQVQDSELPMKPNREIYRSLEWKGNKLTYDVQEVCLI